MHFPNDSQSRAFAAWAGAFYLTIAVSGGFAIAYVPSVLHVPGDPAATLEMIATHRGLFLAGIGGDIVMMAAEVMVTAMLFFMFRHVHAVLSLSAALARFAMVAVMAAMLFFHAGLVALADPASPFAVFAEAEREALAYLMLTIHDSGVWIWQIFFTIHLLILGRLILASGQYPKLLGYGLMLGGLGYVLDSVYAFAFPDLALLGQIRVALLAVVTISEVGFALWLLLRGPMRPAPV